MDVEEYETRLRARAARFNAATMLSYAALLLILGVLAEGAAWYFWWSVFR
jgi:hypothetical protein